MTARRVSSRIAASKTPVPKPSPPPKPPASPSPSATTHPTPSTDLPIIHFPSAADFSSWLASNHATSSGLFLKIAKKSSGIPSATYDSALDVALCWGWIDGQRRTCADDPATFFLQRFTRRRKGSLWSKRNVDKVAALTTEGRMEAAGLREVEMAKEDGRWDRAYVGQSKMEVPKDLVEALNVRTEAKQVFDSLDKGKRYTLLLRLETAKKKETRATRVEKLIDDLAAGKIG
ncbi:bacteriocin-protection, ydeI or ompD-Associated domain-containing protein [Sarocladium implicatum]|nr:bacteriocin-protection, ydeI or ompD-Associated domain-containing protein [Sarocladium implicatum]